MKVIDLMTTEVITAKSSESLKSAARKMVDNRVSGLPVEADLTWLVDDTRLATN